MYVSWFLNVLTVIICSRTFDVLYAQTKFRKRHQMFWKCRQCVFHVPLICLLRSSHDDNTIRCTRSYLSQFFHVPFMMLSRTYWLKFVIFLRFEQSKNFTSKNTSEKEQQLRTKTQDSRAERTAQHRSTASWDRSSIKCCNTSTTRVQGFSLPLCLGFDMAGECQDIQWSCVLVWLRSAPKI